MMKNIYIITLMLIFVSCDTAVIPENKTGYIQGDY